ncbi:MAG: hypothetical protein JWN40_3063, partial [Phycisphaerales bacterium]|nr:hypothetical protein [Phycisphaerales bacterium]
SPFDRLARAEQRLHAMYHRTLRELTALQTRREKRSQNPDHHPSPCPFLPKEEPPLPDGPQLDDLEDEDDDDENEETHENDTDENENDAHNSEIAQNEATQTPRPIAPAPSHSPIVQNEPTAPQTGTHGSPPTKSATP